MNVYARGGTSLSGQSSGYCCSAGQMWCADLSIPECKLADGASCGTDDSLCCNGECQSGYCACTGDGAFISGKSGLYSPVAGVCNTACTAANQATNCISGAVCDAGRVVNNVCITCDSTIHTQRYTEYEDASTIAGTCEESCGASPECDEQSPDSAFCTSDCQSRLLDVFLFPVGINPA